MSQTYVEIPCYICATCGRNLGTQPGRMATSYHPDIHTDSDRQTYCTRCYLKKGGVTIKNKLNKGEREALEHLAKADKWFAPRRPRQRRSKWMEMDNRYLWAYQALVRYGLAERTRTWEELNQARRDCVQVHFDGFRINEAGRAYYQSHLEEKP